MPNSHGGYRRPANPAAVSGPGALSARTDGAPHRMDVTDMPYGDAGSLNAVQSAAPLAAPGAGSVPAPFDPATHGFGLAVPSRNAGQPVTAGAALGAGPTDREIGLGGTVDDELKQRFGPVLPVLMRMADSPYSTSEFRQQVRQLIARIS